MYITVHFDDKQVVLCDARTPWIEEILGHPGTILCEETSDAGIATLLRQIRETECPAGVIVGGDLEKLKGLFWDHFTIIKAAGGLVENECGEFLFIHRRGHWDLPKGKLDEGESIEACAVREIQEETGLRQLTINQPLCSTYHTYVMHGQEILKESYWFHLSGRSEDSLVPQLEEDIDQLRWVTPEVIPTLLARSYPSIREVVLDAGLI